MSKYHASKVIVDGEVYDSKKEYRRHVELKLLEQTGVITDLRRQVRFTLLPSQRDEETGKVIERPVTYLADFVYKDNGRTVVEDVKGFRTKEYTLKRKLMLYIHGIRILET